MVPTVLQSVADTAVLPTVPVSTSHVEFASYALAQTTVRFAFIVFVLFALGSLAVQVVLVWWTYTDAKKHNVQSPELWGLVVFVAPLLGLLLYLLVGRGDQTL